MKKDFFDYISKLMEDNENIYLILIGLGYPRVDEMIEKFPDRVINSEASEQTAMDIAVGLAYSGKIPVTYTIMPFYYRAWETLRTYINRESLHIIMIGAGVKEEYGEHDGFSHSASDAPVMFSTLKKIKQYYPDTKDELITAMNMARITPTPAFINIHR